MRKPSLPQPAKLSQPSLFEVLARHRLFDRLDAARGIRSVVSIAAPPGAGKSTLAASWLASRGIPALWIQADPGDEDLPTFFHYAAQGAKAWMPSAKIRLPAMTPEYAANPTAFARRFFRLLFSFLPPGAAFVVDNHQEVPADSPLQAVLVEAAEALPQGMLLMLISRAELPPAFARLVANRHVARLEYEDLKFSLDEAREFGQGHFGLPVEAMEELHRHSEGWAAGLVLMAEQVRRGGSIEKLKVGAPLQDVFNYFASEIVDHEHPQDRRLLAILGFMPAMTADAARELTGNSGAGELLKSLHSRNLFVDKRAVGADTVYHLHALFGIFLRHRADHTLNSSEKILVQCNAARLLQATEFLEEAFGLYCRAGAWEEAGRMVISRAAALIAAGRGRTVRRWIEQIPADVTASSHWLMHWLGAAQIASAPSSARKVLESACEAAATVGDAECELQSAAGIVECCCIEWHDFRPMDKWMPVLQRALDDRIRWRSADAELRALHALASALVYRDPANPILERCIERVFDAIGRACNPNLKLVAACTLANHGGHNFRMDTARRALQFVEHLMGDAAVTPANRGAAFFTRSWILNTTGDAEAALEAVRAAEAIGRAEDLKHILVFAGFMGSVVDGARGRFDAAEQWIAVLVEGFNPARWYDRVLYANAHSFLGMFSGRHALVLEHAPSAVGLSADGVVSSQVQWRLPLAVAHTDTGNAVEAKRWIGEIEAVVSRHGLNHYRPIMLALRASLAYRSGNNPEGERLLTECLRLCRRYGYGRYLRWARRIMPELCARALACGIETELVREMIFMHRWLAPQDAAEDHLAAWPWAVRVFTFGGFRLEVSGQPLQFGRKTPRKPLALLKCLLCMGGENVPVQRLVDALWPDEDGDAAHKAFNTTLYRLRELLGACETIRMSAGLVTLDRSLVWSDQLAFQALAVSRRGDRECADAMLALYQGSLLEAEEAPWAVAVREDARAQLVRRVVQAGRSMEAGAAYRDAQGLYARGLKAEPLSEALSQGMIRCHVGLGERLEARAYFEAMRERFTRELGIPPSAETETLLQNTPAVPH